MITRHFLTIPAQGTAPARKVHYRRCGSGPALLLVHQSPRSSAEFEALMEEWSAHFTCIAPDTPGFGHSEALPGAPEIEDFADALAQFIEAAGIAGCPAYGFHSGGVILTFVGHRHPELLRAIACGGYGMWTKDERKLFGERYVPPFVLGDYGEHMVWLWNRIQEQSWFFPWFDLRDEARLPQPYAMEQVDEIVTDMLNAGASWTYGYSAVLRAAREIPAPGTPGPQVLVTAYDADPLQSHIDRMGDLPPAWQARKVATPADQLAASLAFLREYAVEEAAPLVEDEHEGFVMVGGCEVHFRGPRGAALLVLHAPGAELASPPAGAIAIDAPGHGLSARTHDICATIAAAAQSLGASEIVWPDVTGADADLLYPDLTPDRFGAHLVRAWSVARAAALFDPWYAPGPGSQLPVDPTALDPQALALRARALLRSGGEARRWHDELQRKSAR